MEAARVAKQRGHEVTLYEKADRLGGQLLIAHVAPGKEEMRSPIDYLSGQLEKLGVRVVLGQEVTPDIVKKEAPDVVVVATGSSQFKPDIPGIDKDKVVMAADVLRGNIPEKEKIVVIGGELVGCEVADFLAEKGKQVTVTRRGKEMAEHMNPFVKTPLMRRMNELNIEMLTGVEYLEITDEGLRILDRDKTEKLIEADHIVLAAGSKPNRGLVEKIRQLTTEYIYEVGDCVEPRMLWNAIHEGAKVARTL